MRCILGRFERWLLERGCKFDKLRIIGEGERRVVARTDINPGDVVLEVPSSALLSVETVLLDHRVKASMRGVNNWNDGNLALACYLAVRSEDDGWQPYVDLLPRDFGHLVHNWDDDELWLVPDMMEEIQTRREEVRRDTESLGLPRLGWAEACVCSRAFSLSTTSRAMVPMADLMNTARHHERCVDFHFRDGVFYMTAVRRVEEGDEVKDSYGKKSNRRYLMNYGFAFEDNVDERGILLDETTIDIPQPDRGFVTDFWNFGTLRLNPDDRMLSVCRVLEARSEDEVSRLRRHFHTPHLDQKTRPYLSMRANLKALATAPILSQDNEARARDRFRSLVRSKRDHVVALENKIIASLSSMSTIKSMTQQNAQHAAYFTIGQRRCLDNALEFVK